MCKVVCKLQICYAAKRMMLQVAAEKLAWDISKKEGFELITICPTFVLGPVISNRADATSILDVKASDSPTTCLNKHAAMSGRCYLLQHVTLSTY